MTEYNIYIEEEKWEDIKSNGHKYSADMVQSRDNSTNSSTNSLNRGNSNCAYLP